MADKGLWPRAGGQLDQTSLWLTAWSVVQGEIGAVEEEAMKRMRKKH